jgi:hypothetical protein
LYKLLSTNILIYWLNLADIELSLSLLIFN